MGSARTKLRNMTRRAGRKCSKPARTTRTQKLQLQNKAPVARKLHEALSADHRKTLDGLPAADVALADLQPAFPASLQAGRPVARTTPGSLGSDIPPQPTADPVNHGVVHPFALPRKAALFSIRAERKEMTTPILRNQKTKHAAALSVLRPAERCWSNAHLASARDGM